MLPTLRQYSDRNQNDEVAQLRPATISRATTANITSKKAPSINPATASPVNEEQVIVRPVIHTPRRSMSGPPWKP